MTPALIERLDTWVREMRNRWLNRLPHDGTRMDMSGDLGEIADMATEFRAELSRLRQSEAELREALEKSNGHLRQILAVCTDNIAVGCRYDLALKFVLECARAGVR